MTPTLAVDTNLPTFTDPTTGNATQTDPFSGNVYVAWAEIDSNTSGGIPGFNPNTIRMAASSDQGANFTHAAYVDNSSNANGHNARPPPTRLHRRSTIHARRPRRSRSARAPAPIPGGQVTIVYDDYGTTAPLDQILDQTDPLGGDVRAVQRDPRSAEQRPPTAADHRQTSPRHRSIPITVNITDPKFTTLQALDVTARRSPAPTSRSSAAVADPAARSAPARPGHQPDHAVHGDIGVDASGTTGQRPNLGGTTLGLTAAPDFGPGRAPSSTARRSARSRRQRHGSRYVGHFRPTAARRCSGASRGSTAAQLNGTWTLQVSSSPADTSHRPRVRQRRPRSTSPRATTRAVAAGIARLGARHRRQGLAASSRRCRTSTRPTRRRPTAYGPIQRQAIQLNNGTPDQRQRHRQHHRHGPGDVPILPAPVIASDNTLGSFSPHQGRLYVAFTGMFSGAQAGNTDIFLIFSDDGGKTWMTQSARASASRSTTTTRPPTASAGRPPAPSTSAAPASPRPAPVPAPGRGRPVHRRRSSSRSSTPATTRPTPGWPPTSPPAATAAHTFAADVYANPTRDRPRRGHRQHGQPRADPRQPVVRRRPAGRRRLRHAPGPGRRQRPDHPVLGVEPEHGRRCRTRPWRADDRRLDPVAGRRAAGHRQHPGAGRRAGRHGQHDAGRRRHAAGQHDRRHLRPPDRPGELRGDLKANTSVFYKSPSGGASVSLPIVTGITDANGNARQQGPAPPSSRSPSTRPA